MKYFDTYKKYRILLWLMMLCWILPLQAGAETAATSRSNAGKAAQGKAAEKLVSIDFNNVDITVLIKFISELTG